MPKMALDAVLDTVKAEPGKWDLPSLTADYRGVYRPDAVANALAALLRTGAVRLYQGKLYPPRVEAKPREPRPPREMPATPRGTSMRTLHRLLPVVPPKANAAPARELAKEAGVGLDTMYAVLKLAVSRGYVACVPGTHPARYFRTARSTGYDADAVEQTVAWLETWEQRADHLRRLAREEAP